MINKDLRLLMVGIVLLIFFSMTLSGQSPLSTPTLGSPSLSDVYSGGSSLMNEVRRLCYIGGAICGIIGGAVAYTEIIDGEESSFVAVRNWFTCCIALLIVPIIIQGLTGF